MISARGEDGGSPKILMIEIGGFGGGLRWGEVSGGEQQQKNLRGRNIRINTPFQGVDGNGWRVFTLWIEVSPERRPGIC